MSLLCTGSPRLWAPIWDMGAEHSYLEQDAMGVRAPATLRTASTISLGTRQEHTVGTPLELIGDLGRVNNDPSWTCQSKWTASVGASYTTFATSSEVTWRGWFSVLGVKLSDSEGNNTVNVQKVKSVGAGAHLCGDDDFPAVCRPHSGALRVSRTSSWCLALRLRR